MSYGTMQGLCVCGPAFLAGPRPFLQAWMPFLVISADVIHNLKGRTHSLSAATDLCMNCSSRRTGRLDLGLVFRRQDSSSPCSNKPSSWPVPLVAHQPGITTQSTGPADTNRGSRSLVVPTLKPCHVSLPTSPTTSTVPNRSRRLSQTVAHF